MKYEKYLIKRRLMRLDAYLIIEKTDNIMMKLKDLFSNIKLNSPDDIASSISDSIKKFGVKKKGTGTYISGPMTNLPDHFYPVFRTAKKYVSGTVHDPSSFKHSKLLKKKDAELDWGDFMTIDVYYLLSSNKIVTLPGFSNSTGAKTELAIGKKVFGIDPTPLKDIIKGKKFDSFIQEVEEEYKKIGLEDDFKNTILPMLTAKTEAEAAKRVKSWTPDTSGKRYDESVLSENIFKGVEELLSKVKDMSLDILLKVLGKIFNQSGIKKIKR